MSAKDCKRATSGNALYVDKQVIKGQEDSMKRDDRHTNGLEHLLEQICKDLNKTVADQTTIADKIIHNDPTIYGYGFIYARKYQNELVKIIISDSRFPGTKVRMLNGWPGPTGFYPNFVWTGLIILALKYGHTRAVELLEAILNQKELKGRLVFIVLGVSLKEKIKIDENMYACDIADLPSSCQLDMLASYADGGRFSLLPIYPHQSMAAFVCKINNTPLFIDNPTLNGSDKIATNNFREIKERVDLLVSSTIFIEKGWPEVFMSWIEYDDVDLNKIRLGCPSLINNADLMAGMRKPIVIRDSDVTEYIAPLLTLEDDQLKRSLVSALERLVRATKENRVEDKAINVAIAFEYLLGDQGHTDIVHKIATRTAKFLGGSTDVRTAHFKAVKKMYDIRSKAIHGSNIKKETAELASIESAADICLKVAKLLLSNRRSNDWNKFDFS